MTPALALRGTPAAGCSALVRRLVERPAEYWLLGALLIGLPCLTLPPMGLAGFAAALGLFALGLWKDAGSLAQIGAMATTLFLLWEPFLKYRVTPLAGQVDEVISLTIWGALFAGAALGSRRGLAIPGALPFLLLWIWQWGSALINAVPPHITFLGILATAKGMAAYWLGYHIKPDSRRLRWYVHMLLAIAMIAAVVAVLQRVRPDIAVETLGFKVEQSAGSKVRSTGIFSHPKELGHFMTLLFTMMIGILVAERRRWMYVGAGVATVLAGLGAALAKSSIVVIAILALVVGMLRSRVVFALTVAAIGAACAIVPTLNLPPQYEYRLESVRNGLRMFETGEFKGNFEWRLYNLWATSNVVRDHPVFGTGPGRWGGFIAKKYYSPEYERYRFKSFILNSLAGMDVDWLRTLGEGGMGLALLVALLMYHLQRQAYYAYRHLPEKYMRAFALSVFLFNIVFLFESFVSQNMEAPFLSYYYWGFNGVLAGWIYQEKGDSPG